MHGTQVLKDYPKEKSIKKQIKQREEEIEVEIEREKQVSS